MEHTSRYRIKSTFVLMGEHIDVAPASTPGFWHGKGYVVQCLRNEQDTSAAWEFVAAFPDKNDAQVYIQYAQKLDEQANIKVIF